ncbi:UbiA prenyltransferase family [Schizophyllum amplum]|uniref:UbiA prenyltransferase family n=1 Tax=Schizophyllum amplum TaxID=97359 RepID=A0A550CW77_9AGAR|nr:UbiA prenyltransferase family [Auriculariopsis ampla]
MTAFVASSPELADSHSLARFIMDLPYTLYLFNKTDITTTVLPILGIGLALAQPAGPAAAIRGLLWLQLHLIPFEIQNQIVGLEEDRIAKPFRPIVAGRISVKGANCLYMILVALSVVMSGVYGGLKPCLIHLAAMTAYNEGGLASNWFLKSAIGALGTSCYCWGVTLMFNNGLPLTHTARVAIGLCFFNFLTTGHTQDFRDRAGDAAVGRKTLAVMLPQTLGRWLLLSMIFAWSGGLVYLWQAPAAAAALNFALAGACAVRLIVNHSEESDKAAYWWYNMWFLSCQLLPIFMRFRS